MNTSQYLSLAMSSLVAGGAMLLGSPAEAVVLTTTGPNTSSFPLIGVRFVVAGIDGRPVNINSLSSGEFPITQIVNNNSTEVTATIFGGAVASGGSSSFSFDIADYEDGLGGARLASATSFLATPTGVQELNLPVLSFAGTASPGATSPFSAFQVVTNGEFNGQPVNVTSIFQVPGSTLTLGDSSFESTFDVSSQPISGYVPVEQLNNFGNPTQISLEPGSSVTVAVPEPTTMIATGAALGFGAFFKRKSSKSKTKAIG